MARNFKLTIEYDGTDFCGWQIQKNGERTVQAEVTKACETIFKQKVTVIASGRTDSGVHARGQVIHFHVDTRMRPLEVLKALNSRLPQDIAVLNVKEVRDSFHSQYSVKTKTYRYCVLNAKQRSVFENRYAYFYPYVLDIKAMRMGARILCGRHDFKAFQAHDPLRADKDTVRTIKSIKIKKEGDKILIDVSADGFLYKMVRNIAGSLISLGAGQIAMSDLSNILESKERAKAPATAPAYGLCLQEVKY